MFWFLYILSSFLLSLVAASISKKFYSGLVALLFIMLVTPSQIDIGSSDYAPALTAFTFNILFEENFTTRPLRPLAISIPLTLIFIKVFSVARRKFS